MGFRYGCSLTADFETVSKEMIGDVLEKISAHGWNLNKNYAERLNLEVGEVANGEFVNADGNTISIRVCVTSNARRREVYIGFCGFLYAPDRFESFGEIASQTALRFYWAVTEFFSEVEFDLELDCDATKEFCERFRTQFKL